MLHRFSSKISQHFICSTVTGGGWREEKHPNCPFITSWQYVNQLGQTYYPFTQRCLGLCLAKSCELGWGENLPLEMLYLKRKLYSDVEKLPSPFSCEEGTALDRYNALPALGRYFCHSRTHPSLQAQRGSQPTGCCLSRACLWRDKLRDVHVPHHHQQ